MADADLDVDNFMMIGIWALPKLFTVAIQMYLQEYVIEGKTIWKIHKSCGIE